jgi:DNA-binding transcriptional regulator YhcF (GntR family)
MSPAPPVHRYRQAEELVRGIFEAGGWRVEPPPDSASDEADLIVRHGHLRFVLEIKALSEGRADRAIPLLSQAILQAQAYAQNRKSAQPLAVICVENASPSLIQQIRAFADKYAPNVPIGIVAESGLRYFQGAGLEGLNTEQEEPRKSGLPLATVAINLFSYLNLWMLKVLLAPEIPHQLMKAPRRRYRSGAELAEAAQVSAMSASRFLQQLRNEGFLDDVTGYLVLVRRKELFRRWRSAAMRTAHEMPMRFLIKGATQQQLHRLLADRKDSACLGLFAAADALHLGHVSGVPAYVYVTKLPRPGDEQWNGLIALPHEAPDLILRQTRSPNSTFRAAVHHADVAVTDVIQTWLDVSNHPARGEEQAELIYQNVLRPIVDSNPT